MVANTWLMQFQADILGVPVEVPKITETYRNQRTGRGLPARLATSFWKSHEELGAKGSSRLASSRRWMRSSGTSCTRAGRRL